jgi:hypothetical protein
MVIAGQLSTEYLRATQAQEKAQKERNNNKRVVQKYGELYSNVARRQIVKDEEEEREVVNIREQRCKRSRKNRRPIRQRPLQRLIISQNRPFK